MNDQVDWILANERGQPVKNVSKHINVNVRDHKP